MASAMSLRVGFSSSLVHSRSIGGELNDGRDPSEAVEPVLGPGEGVAWSIVAVDLSARTWDAAAAAPAIWA